MYGYWKVSRPQEPLLVLARQPCIRDFRGPPQFWREIQDYQDGLKYVIAFVKENQHVIIDFVFDEHVNDVERHIHRIKYAQGVPGTFMYADLLEPDSPWQQFAGAITYKDKVTGENGNIEDLKTSAIRVARRRRGATIKVDPRMSLRLKLSWHPHHYRYNAENDKFEGMQHDTKEWHQVDPDATLTDDNEPADVPSEFWEQLKADPGVPRSPAGARFKVVTPRNTASLPKISTPMEANAKILDCTKPTVFNPLYMSKHGHCVFYSACLWMDFQGMTKAPKILSKMSPAWVFGPAGRCLAVFSERVQSRSRMLPFQLRRVPLKGLFDAIMAHRVRGVYSVVLMPSDHAVVIDANCQLIFDCAEDAPLVLSRSNLSQCIGRECIGFEEARRWAFK